MGGFGDFSIGADNSFTRAIIIIVFPLPGSPFIHSSWASSLSFQRRKSRSSRSQEKQSVSNRSLLFSILIFSTLGSVFPLKSFRHWLALAFPGDSAENKYWLQIHNLYSYLARTFLQDGNVSSFLTNGFCPSVNFPHNGIVTGTVSIHKLGHILEK